MIFLGIETSCDETAAAIVNNKGEILGQVILSQLQEHRPYGGVVPELAARAHLDYLPNIIQQTLIQAQLNLNQLQGIAVTAGPGLIGGVLVGVMTAKALSAATNLPLYGINHLEGHALSPRLNPGLEFPYLLLLVSGGHCQFLHVQGVGQYHLLGKTLDDAVGEAFDKVAQTLNLGHPGGPAVEQAAIHGNPRAYNLPQPLKGREGCDLSFAGLKTAVKVLTTKLMPFQTQQIADIAASFQWTVAQVLVERLQQALKMAPCQQVVIAGGVAANQYLRQHLQGFCDQRRLIFKAPPMALCTDNAAMIAWAGLEHATLGHEANSYFIPKPRWPITEL